MRSALLSLMVGVLTLAPLLLSGGGPLAAEVTFKLHHFLPAESVVHERFLNRWAEKVTEESGGRIEIRIFPDMRLGGKPADLYDQLRDGVVDMAWLAPSYSPGRFPITGVFELPFMISRADSTSRALQIFADQWLSDEYAEVKPLIFHVHDRGVLHTRERRITRKEDFAGLRIRAPSRAFGAALAALGATPVYLPVPDVPQALRDDLIDGAALPFEITLPLKIQDEVKFHTEIRWKRGFYTTVFLFAMNQDSYQNLPADLRAVIDRNTGEDMASVAGQIWDEAEAPGRQAAVERGNEIVVLNEVEVERLRRATSPVVQGWIDQMTVNGLDGAEILNAARGLIAEHSDEP